MKTKCVSVFNKVCLTTLTLGSLFLASAVNADVAAVSGKVTRVLHVNDTTFGSCMALLDVDPSRTGLSCQKWVSFSCAGTYNTKDAGYRMFDVAQMSLALNKTVVVWMDDAKKHNGFCTAKRIDVVK